MFINLTNFLTKLRGKPEISKTREVSTPVIREIISHLFSVFGFQKKVDQFSVSQKPTDREPADENQKTENGKLITESLVCPYCASKNFVKRGFRAKKLERVQLLLCMDCHKTFTPQITKGKHYPLATIFDAVSLYNLGYSLEESCRKVNAKASSTKKPTLTAGFGDPTKAGSNLAYHLKNNLAQNREFVNSQNKPSFSLNKSGVEVAGFAPAEPWMISQIPYSSTPTSELVSHIDLQPSTLSNWLSEFKEMMPFERMRDFMMSKYTPRDAIVTATLAHQQLYRYRFHRAKCAMVMAEHFHHGFFKPLKEFLELVPSECPHQFFSTAVEPAKDCSSSRSSDELRQEVKSGGSYNICRASDAPLTFSKTAMIVRGKTNFATKTANFVLQSVKERKARHEAVQKFMLYNDSVTVATEVPVYLTRDDLEHMKTQLGFEIYENKLMLDNRNSRLDFEARGLRLENPTSNFKLQDPTSSIQCLSSSQLPKLITGHIDILQIRNGMVHLLDFKPNAEKERPIEQLTLYAMALSRLTGLRLFEFKCAWFDEKDYFEFYPLHVLHKPKKARRRRKVYTMEGTYAVNKNESKIEQMRPVPLR